MKESISIQESNMIPLI